MVVSVLLCVYVCMGACVYACMCDVSGVLKVWYLLLMCYFVYVYVCLLVCVCVCTWRTEGLVIVGNVLLRVCVRVCMRVCGVSGVLNV